MAFLSSFLDMVRTIRLNDVIDMAIMAFIFYKVLYFLARTGSGRVVRGILLLVAVLLLAKALNLYVVNYIFGKTFELGVLALLIIFQPEVRSLLEKVGGITKYISGRNSPRDVEDAIAQVVLACRDLAETKTGALIVFERDNTLEEAVKTGTLIHADVKAELLKNIFYPNTPLHDGAAMDLGARGLRSIMENLMRDIMFRIPSEPDITGVEITAAAVRGEEQPRLIRSAREIAG